MKFSYSLIKSFAPWIKSKTALIDALTTRSFEAEDISDDTIEISLPPNRYSDCASHYGIAKEASAIFGKPLKKLEIIGGKSSKSEKFSVQVEDKKLCPRYTAWFFDGIVIKPSPLWMQKTIKECGLRPINNIVDTMNYAMLEIGQPLHAFDYDKLAKGKNGKPEIIIRRARKGESIITIDGNTFELTPDALVIADNSGPLAIAGIKGGKRAEISKDTKRIIVESAIFDSVSIYKTSKFLRIVTDASVRFSHDTSIHLSLFGMERVAYILKKEYKTIPVYFYDSTPKLMDKIVLKFDINLCNKMLGSKITEKQASDILVGLGFKKLTSGKWEVPNLRTDIKTREDIIEEIARMVGYENLPSYAPIVPLKPSETQKSIIIKDKIRKILTALGIDEVYTNSFISKEKHGMSNELVELQNPISLDQNVLRPSLDSGLMNAAEENKKFFNSVKIFEIGNIFKKIGEEINESASIGIVINHKEKETFFELKGIISRLMDELGIVDYVFIKDKNNTKKLNITIEKNELGNIQKCDTSENKRSMSVAELNINILALYTRNKKDYLPPPKFPSIMRDISIVVDDNILIGEVMDAIAETDIRFIDDVDLIDEYKEDKLFNEQNLTFRIMFRSDDRTLKREEVDKEIDKIQKVLEDKFNAIIR